MTPTSFAGHRVVARCARSLTHIRVRSLTCSFAPTADLASEVVGVAA